MSESACTSPSGRVRSQTVPFERIPGQSKLFLQYLSDARSLSQYYPNAVDSHAKLADLTSTVLENYSTDRDELADILSRQSKTYGGGSETEANIARLRETDCVTVVTGQQAGVLTGPLYTIYKAMSAIKSAEDLRRQGVNAVPVFWIATEDHDFEEISSAFALGTTGELSSFSIRSGEDEKGKPVGSIRLQADASENLEEFFANLPDTQFSSHLRRSVENAYASAEPLGTAFARMLNALLGRFGLVIFDPMDDSAKRLAAPLITSAIEKSDQIVNALVSRSAELVAAGYHSQVLIEADYFPMFYIDEDGLRRSLKGLGEGRYRLHGTRRVFQKAELVEISRTSPERFSPAVMLRPVVQDVLFPTLAYFGGAAEIAYFAQNSVVYKILGRPVTPILPRQSFTFVEAKHARTMEAYDLEFQDIFEGLEKIKPKIVEEFLDPETPKAFAELEQELTTGLEDLKERLVKIDPTLGAALSTRKRKMLYHIEAMRKKFQRASFERNETIERRVGSLFDALWPRGGLQERTVNVIGFIARYGDSFLDAVHQNSNVNNNDHRVVYF